jgi:citrate lyase beta subunit
MKDNVYVSGVPLMKKLTLSMDEKDVRTARRLAREHRTSISRMFSRMVRAMSRRKPDATDDLPPITRKALGMIRLPKGKTDRQLIEEALLARHGLDK